LKTRSFQSHYHWQ